MSGTVRVGYIPYLNMAPFHQGFGPQPLQLDGNRFEFQTLSPHALGQAARRLEVDAGAMSLADLFECADYEPLGALGIGVARAAQSVLLFSTRPVESLAGTKIAVTDETSTSVQLLRLLLERRYQLQGVRYERFANGRRRTHDVDGDAYLLIGDAALEAAKDGMAGFPHALDLGESWFAWQGTPFAFARWAVRRTLANDIKNQINLLLEKSLSSIESDCARGAEIEAGRRGWPVEMVERYWRGFSYRLTPPHEKSIREFGRLLEAPCLSA